MRVTQGVFMLKNADWIPSGYRLDTILDRVDVDFYFKESNCYAVLDTVDTINSNPYAREELIHTCLTDKKHKLKISRVSFNRKNGIHPIQLRKRINKLNSYKKSTVSKMVPRPYPDGIQ
ncbi:hypothetical protein [uncultured Parasutterella sp.]|uniref:hypothetical protein n=1 Tax=uncultured Parasutterella sp. TaxID=1263098 RepID=UPI00258C3691|nr:hypothetical protein [uncultured Parasutterella sp.]